MAGASAVTITIEGAPVLATEMPAGGEREKGETAGGRFSFPRACGVGAGQARRKLILLRPPFSFRHQSCKGSASATFAALKSTIGTCLTSIMMDGDGADDALDVLEEVVSEEDMDAETAALAGGALPPRATRSKPRPAGKGGGQRERQQQARGVKRAAPAGGAVEAEGA